jgi:hypothetical protein
MSRTTIGEQFVVAITVNVCLPASRHSMRHLRHCQVVVGGPRCFTGISPMNRRSALTQFASAAPLSGTGESSRREPQTHHLKPALRARAGGRTFERGTTGRMWPRPLFRSHTRERTFDVLPATANGGSRRTNFQSRPVPDTCDRWRPDISPRPGPDQEAMTVLCRPL